MAANTSVVFPDPLSPCTSTVTSNPANVDDISAKSSPAAWMGVMFDESYWNLSIVAVPLL